MLIGIEIAHRTLLDEIEAVIADGGSYINYRHIALLCDVMTACGSNYIHIYLKFNYRKV